MSAKYTICFSVILMLGACRAPQTNYREGQSAGAEQKPGEKLEDSDKDRNGDSKAEKIDPKSFEGTLLSAEGEDKKDKTEINMNDVARYLDLIFKGEQTSLDIPRFEQMLIILKIQVSGQYPDLSMDPFMEPQMEPQMEPGMPPHPNRRPHHRDPMAKFDMMLSCLDADADDMLSREEWVNQEGSMDCFLASLGHMQPPGSPEGPMAPGMPGGPKSMPSEPQVSTMPGIPDSNDPKPADMDVPAPGDTVKISHLDRLFEAFDTDQDQKLSKDELRDLLVKFKRKVRRGKFRHLFGLRGKRSKMGHGHKPRKGGREKPNRGMSLDEGPRRGSISENGGRDHHKRYSRRHHRRHGGFENAGERFDALIACIDTDENKKLDRTEWSSKREHRGCLRKQRGEKRNGSSDAEDQSAPVSSEE